MSKYNDSSGEIWVSVPGYEGFYECSNFGNVRSVTRKVSSRNRFSDFQREYKSRPIRFNIRTNGYFCVELNKEKDVKKFSVHRLVYNSFFGKVKEGDIIHHIDGNKNNNKINNLEPMDYFKHNNIHKHQSWNKGLKGFRAGIPRDSKIYDSIRKKVKNVETGEIFNSAISAAKSIDRKANSISRCLKNNKYTAGGYHFEYAV